MHRAEVDPEHNRLILRWVNSLSLSEVDLLQAEVTTLLPKLRPGFDCLSDTANMRPTSRHISERIEKLQAFLHGSGMGVLCALLARVGAPVLPRHRWSARRSRPATRQFTWIPRRRPWPR